MKRSCIRFLCVGLLFSPLLVNVTQGQTTITPRIINGKPTDDFESVGIVGTKQLGGVATGTLISPSHVLTAGHVGVLVQHPTDGTFELNGKTYTTSHVYVNPGYNSRTDADDIAIYQLSQAITDVTPSAIFRGTPLVGELLTLVGYGASGNGTTGQDGTFGTKLVGTTAIDKITSTQIIWTFDNNNESDTAYGDSGGPAYLLVDGEYFIAGITSGGSSPTSTIGDVSYDTRVDAFASWIDSIVSASSVTPPNNGGQTPPVNHHPCPPTHIELPGHEFHPGTVPGLSFHPAEHPWHELHPAEHPAVDAHPGVWALLDELLPLASEKHPAASRAPDRSEGRGRGR